ncbi:MAG: SCP2 sterol-binding domain-containing protein [Chromatiaceae bacterium]|jgi:putative sterol carrier protein|nr:SCP2 sterol-binding domain-containing protein [Chromatiaceae bacterium]
MIRELTRALPAIALAFSGGANAAIFMDAQWASQMCSEWNKSNLATALGGESWAANNDDRGYKLIHLYREKCGDQSKVELEISDKDGKAYCSYGGAVKHAEPNYDVDYLMHATDEDWTCMGEGKFGCGAMGAMTTGKLKFKGPKMEAMGVMGPFDGFLVLTGKVAGDKGSCP